MVLALAALSLGKSTWKKLSLFSTVMINLTEKVLGRKASQYVGEHDKTNSNLESINFLPYLPDININIELYKNWIIHL